MSENPPNKLRVLVDANVLVAGSAWPRFPYEVLQHGARGDFQLVLSDEIIGEARDALAEIAPERIERLEAILLASNYEQFAAPTDEEIATNSALVRDAKDVHVALTAIGAKIDYFVTQDKDFTDSTAPIRDRVAVLLPGTFLRERMGWTSEALEAIRQRKWSELDIQSDDKSDE